MAGLYSFKFQTYIPYHKVSTTVNRHLAMKTDNNKESKSRVILDAALTGTRF